MLLLLGEIFQILLELLWGLGQVLIDLSSLCFVTRCHDCNVQASPFVFCDYKEGQLIRESQDCC